MPNYVTRDLRKGTCYRPYLGRVEGKIKWGKRVRLGSHDMSAASVWEALEERGISPVKRDKVFVPFPTLSANHKLNTAYKSHKNSARKRGISFEFSKREWYKWWGDDILSRGTCGDQLQMCRINDEGPYHPDNVYKATQRRNMLDAYHRRVKARQK